MRLHPSATEVPLRALQFFGAGFGLILAGFLGAIALSSVHAQTGAVQRSAGTLVQQAAEALGGAERLRSVKNITLAGYGQYAYMFGGGRITGSPDAPEKYQAANDLRRVYDLEHGRFQQLERRNMLFPFLAAFGHNYALNNLVLDGDIAFDINGGKTVRVPRWVDGILQLDGVHMRRMWMLNNPIALVRALLDPGTTCSAPRREGASTVVNATLKQGDKLSAGFSPNHLTAWVRWSNPHTDLGEVTFTTYFTGYGAYDGVLLPLGYDTRLDWRNIDYLKIYVDNYLVDSEIANLAAPAEIREAQEPSSDAVQPLASEPVARGIWRISPGGTTVIEFKDHITLFELDANVRQAKAVIAYARTLAPGKPVTQLIVSHAHFDHAAGLRQAVAEGLTVISRRGNEGIFREMATHPAPDFPDDLAKSPKPVKFIPVDEQLRLSDDTMTVDVLWARNNTHMADAVFAYAPAQKVVMEGDIATAAYDYQFWPDNFRDLIDYYKLDVEKLSPVHSVSREYPGELTMEQVDELVKGGTQRARERCASELAKGNYFPGCPVWSKRY
jgi:glyoxylase-like metal-dependent hydrolase (beta-lactamase superfamily II)